MGMKAEVKVQAQAPGAALPGSQAERFLMIRRMTQALAAPLSA